MIIRFKQPGSPKKFELIPGGYYAAEVIDALSMIASTGTNYLRVECLITEGRYQGRHVWGNLFDTEKGAWKFGALLNAAGIEAKDELDTDELIGKRLEVRVKHGTDLDGNTREEIATFRKPRQPKAASGDEVPF